MRCRRLNSLLAAAFVFYAVVPVAAAEEAGEENEEAEQEEDRGVVPDLRELGYVATLGLELGPGIPAIQEGRFGASGSNIDLRDKDAGAPLFVFSRGSVEMPYPPGSESDSYLAIVQQSFWGSGLGELERPIAVGDREYESGSDLLAEDTSIAWRISYVADLWPERQTEFGMGASLHYERRELKLSDEPPPWRTSDFSREDRRILPMFKMRWRHGFGSGIDLGFAFNGIALPLRTEELSVDTSLHLGYRFTSKFRSGLVVRYLIDRSERARGGEQDFRYERHLMTGSLAFSYDFF